MAAVYSGEIDVLHFRISGYWLSYAIKHNRYQELEETDGQYCIRNLVKACTVYCITNELLTFSIHDIQGLVLSACGNVVLSDILLNDDDQTKT